MTIPDSNSPAATPNTNNRWPLILLSVLFIGPFVGAAVLYFFFPNFHPSARLNHGDLITPARPVPSLNFTTASGAVTTEQLLWGKWSLIYLGGNHCDDACAERLYMSRQVRIRTRERERLQRVYMAPNEGALEAARATQARLHPDLVWAIDSSAAGQTLSDFIKPTDPQALYLLDPHGNWLMVYPGDTQPADLLADLKKLLSLSQIG